MNKRIKRTFYFLGHIIFGFMSLGTFYLLMAFILGLISVNNDFDRTRGAIEIFLVEKNGHASVVLPVKTDQIDWTTVFSPQNTSQPTLSQLQPYIQIGWGSKTFYTRVQRWKNLKPSTAVQSLFFDRGIINTIYVDTPISDVKTQSIKITEAQYKNIITQIRSELTLQNGMAKVVENIHFDENKSDAFYDSKSIYTPWKTSNQWTRNLLSKANITMPLWAPFSQTLFWHL